MKVRESILRESTIMVSFQRMKEDFDDISTQVEIPICANKDNVFIFKVGQKLPGKTVVWVFLGVCVAIVFIIGFGIGFGSAGGAGDQCKGAENCQEGGVSDKIVPNHKL